MAVTANAMNERDELTELKALRARLERELGHLSLRLDRLERRLNAARTEQQQTPDQEPSSPAHEAVAETPASAESVAPEQPLAVAQATADSEAPLEVPPVISEVLRPAAATGSATVSR